MQEELSIRSQIINLITLPLFRQQEAAEEYKRNVGYYRLVSLGGERGYLL